MKQLGSLVLVGSVVALSSFSGCGRKPPGMGDTTTPIVTISQPIERAVTDYVDFTGRTEAVYSVDIRGRVTGYLMKMPFKEGAEIKVGDVLFEIDDRPYKADLDRAKGDVERQKASVVKAQADYDIALNIQKENPKAISLQEISKRLGSRDEAAGQLKATEANQANAQLNYNWCKVTSPIDGQVSRYYLTLGNLTNQDTTILTTVVSQDPMYVYFDVDERTVLKVLRTTLLPSPHDPLEKRQVPVFMGLEDEEGFSHQGYIDFANNKIDPSTGTINVRGVFANPTTPSGKRLLRPGMFVRVHLPIGKPHPAILVSEKAIGTDQGNKYLLIVNDKDVVEYRPITAGPLQDDGLRVIENGLKAGEWVIVSGLQLARPKMTVQTEKEPMPVKKSAEGK